MPLLLRDYQLAAIQAVRARSLEDDPSRARCIINLPTGTGKSATAITICANALSRGHRVLWLAHRTELLDQAIDTMRVIAPEHVSRIGVVKADRDECARDFVIASCQTLWQEKRLQAVMSSGAPFGVVIWDEVHHAASNSNQRIMAALPADAIVIGLTATVERGDSVSLRGVFPGGIAYQLPLMLAIQQGYLVPFTPIPVKIEDLHLDDIGTVAGDYNQGQLGAEMERDIITDATAHAVIAHASDRHSIIFTVTVRQAEEVVRKLNRLGHRSELLHAETPAEERKGMLRLFREGSVKALASCAILTEGFDAPIADCVVVARPTRAKCLYIQQLGRGLRLHPQTNKRDCLVIDLMGATVRHSPYQASVLIEEALAPACPDCKHSMIEHEDDDEDVSMLACSHWDGMDACLCKTRKRDKCGVCKHPNDHHVITGEDEDTYHKRCQDHKVSGEPCDCEKDVPKQRIVDDWEPKTWARWIHLEDEDAWIASGPNRLTVVVYPNKSRNAADYDPNQWRMTAWSIMGRLDATPTPVWEEMAIGIGEDILRRAGAKAISKKDADWRAKPASPRQFDALRKWRIPVEDPDTGEPLILTSGEAGDMMTEAIGRMRLRDLRRGRDRATVLPSADALKPPDEDVPF